MAPQFQRTDKGEKGLVQWCDLPKTTHSEQKKEEPGQETCQRHWTFEQYEFESLGREFYLSVFLTLTPLPRSLPHKLLFCVWCRGYCFKQQLLFLLSGKPSSFTSPEMKAKSRLWECSLKKPSQKRRVSSWICVRTTFPMLPFDQSRGVFCWLFFFLLFGRRRDPKTRYWGGCEEIQFVSSSSLRGWDSTAVTQFVCLIT